MLSRRKFVEASRQGLKAKISLVEPPSPRDSDPVRKKQEIEYRAVLREVAWVMQGKRCAYCRDPLELKDATADHLHPADKGGTTTPENIAAACRPCNRAKGAMSEGRFRKLINHPRPWDLSEIWLAHFRLRLNRATERACAKILSFVGKA
jgi:5-methylcytosine-specific restriction endonuclease McrA